MAERQQVLWLNLKGNCLQVRRIGKDGKRKPKTNKWKIGKKSFIPREMFFSTRGFLQQSVKRHGTETLDSVMAAGWLGLKQAGKAFGCEIKKGVRLADLYWLLDEQRLVAWQIHESSLDERRIRKLVKSKAPLRIAVVMKRGGYFEIKPQTTKLIHQ